MWAEKVRGFPIITGTVVILITNRTNAAVPGAHKGLRTSHCAAWGRAT